MGTSGVGLTRLAGKILDLISAPKRTECWPVFSEPLKSPETPAQVSRTRVQEIRRRRRSNRQIPREIGLSGVLSVLSWPTPWATLAEILVSGLS